MIRKNDQKVKEKIRVVGSGLDIIYIGFHGELREDLPERLENKKRKSQSNLTEIASVEKAKAQIDIGDQTFKVSSSGESPYYFVVENGSYRIKIVQRNIVQFPPVYVEIKSDYIMDVGEDKAVDNARKIVEEILVEIEHEKVSKVEMYCDLVGVNLSQEDLEKFVSRARIDATYRENKKFTGFLFGTGKIIGKVYNKSLELKKSHKEYMYDAWEDVGKDETVWRVEFELKRKILKEYSIESYDEFKEKSGDLWKYLTEDWLSEREFDNKNTTRRTLTTLWEEVSSVRKFFGDITGAVREKVRGCSLEHLLKMVAGLSTSIGAQLGETVFWNVWTLITLTVIKNFSSTEELLVEGFAPEVIRKSA